MARRVISSRSLYRKSNDVLLGSSICVLLLLIQKGNAYTFKVGGSGDWAVSSDPNTNTFNQWAEKSRFHIGDSLMFGYPAEKDSVLLVTKDDYTNCNTAAPIEKHSDGNTLFSFNRSGPFYFISGVQENCKKNEKMVVVVMADRTGRSSSPPPEKVLPPSPAPTSTSEVPPPSSSPAEATSPQASEVPPPSPSPAEATLPPASEVPPTSPAPAGEEAPPPPEESTPAPSQESNPPKKRNGASSIFTSSISSIGALIGSSLILAF